MARGVDGDRRMGIEQKAAFSVNARHLLGAAGFSRAEGVELGADRPERDGGNREAAGLRQARHHRAHGRRLAPARVEQQPLEV